MSVEFEMAPWMHTPDVADRIRQAWRTARPLMDWLAIHVVTDEGTFRLTGPDVTATTLTAPDVRFP